MNNVQVSFARGRIPMLILALVPMIQLALPAVSGAQGVIRKEEPILAGIPGGSADWEHTPILPEGFDSSWQFFSAAHPNGTVFSIAPDYTSGTYFIGGSFDSAGSSPAANIARLDPNQSQSMWQALGSGVNGAVYSVVTSNEMIFAGGLFDSAGGMPTHHIAMFDGQTWHSLGEGSENGTDSTVLAMALMGDSLYVGGNFQKAGGKIANYIARWNLHSQAWEAVDDDGVVGMDGGVATLLGNYDHTSGPLLVGGGFLHAGRTSASKIARLDSGTWSAFGDGIKDSTGVVESICVVGPFPYGGRGWVVGGHFTKAGDTLATDLALWLTSFQDTGWYSVDADILSGATGTVYAVSSGARLFVGGDFVPRTGVAPQFLFAEEWYSYPFHTTRVGSGVDGTVYAIQASGGIFPEGYSERAVIGGAFHNAGGGGSPYLTIYSDGASVARNAPAHGYAILPNPAQTTIHIVPVSSGGHATIISATVFDICGRTVASLPRMIAGDWVLDASGIPAGSYVVKIVTSEGIEMSSLSIVR